MPKKKILIIDDEMNVARMAMLCLEDTGKYEVEIETEGEKALEAAKKFAPDLILLDLMIPGTSGFQICKDLKASERFSSIPIIILSAKKDESDKVAGLDSGADDYIVKPFSVNELDSRIRAVLRRTQGGDTEETMVRVGDKLVMDLQRYEVTVLDKKIKLTTVEFTLLQLLAARKGYVFSRARILDYLWGSAVGVTERTVDVHVTHLREKLGEASKLIKSIRGIGYKIDDTEKDE